MREFLEPKNESVKPVGFGKPGGLPVASTRQSKEDFQLLVGHGKWQRNCGGMLLIDARFQWMNQNKLAKLPNLPQRERVFSGIYPKVNFGLVTSIFCSFRR